MVLDLYGELREVSRALLKLKDDITSGISTGFSVVMEPVKRTINTLVTITKEAPTKIITGIKNSIETLAQLPTNAINKVSGTIETLESFLRAFINNTVEKLSAIYQSTTDYLAAQVGSIISGLEVTLERIYDGIKTLVIGVLDGFADVVANLGFTIVGAVKGMIALAFQANNALHRVVREMLQGMVDTVKTTVATLERTIYPMIDYFFESLADWTMIDTETIEAFSPGLARSIECLGLSETARK